MYIEMSMNLRFSALLILALIILSGCSDVRTPASATPTATRLPPIVTSTAERTETPAPLVTFTTEPSSTLTQTATRTPKPTPTSTWTPLPTLSEPEARALLRELYQDNAGCRFPCWWGITPGETDWATAKQFLGQFSTIWEGPKKYFFKEAGKQQYSMGAEFRYMFGNETVWGSLGILNGVVAGMSIVPESSTYPLTRVLKEYGQPPEIFIRTFQSSPEGYLPFYLILYYPDLDTVAKYETGALIVNRGNVLRGCLHDIDPSFDFNPSIGNMTYNELVEFIFGTDPTSYPIPILEATGMDVSDFYQYALSHSQICIDTPSELWQP